MSLPILKCFLFVFFVMSMNSGVFVDGGTKIVHAGEDHISYNGNVQFNPNPSIHQGTRAGSIGDYIASRTGYAVSETGRSIGLLTLAVLIGIPIIIVVLLLLFLPIPMAIGRRTARMAHEVLESDECVERIACEVLRFSRGMEFDTEWVQSMLSNESVNPHVNTKTWMSRVAQGASNNNCMQLTCDPVGSLTKTIR